MKSRINKIKESENDYPKLMFNKEAQDLIVLFYRDRNGTVVNSDPKCPHNIGDMADNWDPSGFWQDFDGEVVLSNE